MPTKCAIVTVETMRGIDHSRGMEPKSDELDLTGQLLLAMPGIGDPRFEFGVILICSHSSEGAMGLMINKPAPDISLGKVLKQLKIAPLKSARNVPVQTGGPVEPGRGFVLHTNDYVMDETSLQVGNGMALTVTMGILEQLARGTGPEKSIMCMGYAGWGPMQLEGELQQNGWLTCPATQELIFGENHSEKWQSALQSMGIDPLLLSAEGGIA
ncbi:MAG: YqgE/AlgH family protein [Litoreibacter sp.]